MHDKVFSKENRIKTSSQVNILRGDQESEKKKIRFLFFPPAGAKV